MYRLNGKEYNEDPFSDFQNYGKGLFETLYGIDNKIIFYKEHLDRLKFSMKFIKLECEFNIEKEIEDILRQNIYKEFMLKILVAEETFYLKLLPFQGRYFEGGIKAKVIKNFYQNEIGMVKSTNYLLNILAREELLEEGCFEGVFTNRLGQITEGTISNLFFTKDKVVYTPKLNLNILPGITRKKIIGIIREKLELEVQEGYFTLDNLKGADSIFFTNSLMKKGLVWVEDFEGKKYKKDEIIHKIENSYLKLLSSML